MKLIDTDPKIAIFFSSYDINYSSIFKQTTSLDTENVLRVESQQKKPGCHIVVIYTHN